MSKTILIIQGHPDSGKNHLCHALAAAYAEGAQKAGHDVSSINVAELDFPMLRTEEDFYGELPSSLHASRDALQAADHLVFFYPLWLGTMPALLKAFIEQLFRPGIALGDSKDSKGWPKQLLKGKSGHIVVTMGMPALFYRWFYRAHSVKSLERNVLKFSGVKPVKETILGMVHAADDKTSSKWFENMRRLGADAK